MQDDATVEECAICNVMLNALDTDGTCYLRHGEAIAHKMARAMTKSRRPLPRLHCWWAPRAVFTCIYALYAVKTNYRFLKREAGQFSALSSAPVS